VSNAPSKPVSFSRPKVGYFSNRPRIQGVSRLVYITAGGDFLGLFDQNSSYKHMSNFELFWNYRHFLILLHALM